MFEDLGFSGATVDRPAFASMLNAESFEAVTVYAWDRFARDAMLDGWIRFELQKRSVGCLSATQESGADPTSIMVQNMLAAVAGFERHVIAQRLAGGRKAKARLGGYAHGQPRYGTQKPAEKRGFALRVRDDEAPTLELMQTLRAQGTTLRAISAALNESGYKPRKAVTWIT